MAQQPDALTTAPSSSDPEELRREIARTRADMGTTVDAIEDRVSPRRIRERQADRLRSRLRGAREAVMGAPEGGGERVVDMTRGNPLAAGMIAFGVGALAGSLVPASQVERRAGSQIRDAVEEPVMEHAKQAGQDVGAHLQQEAQRAGEEVRGAAQQATHDVRDSVGGPGS
jgi:hypothetical protein